MRLLFVATTFSVIAARWIEQLADTGWDIHVYSTNEDVIHPYFRNVTVYTKGSSSEAPRQIEHVTLRSAWPLKRGRARLRQYFPRIADVLDPAPPQHIANLIRKLKPDCVHSLKMQNEGYYVLEAKNLLANQFQTTWIHSMWGGDIYMFGHINDHVRYIKDVLSSCDYLLAGNPRDAELARQFGYTGELLGIIPSGGGWPIAQMRQKTINPPSQRNIIAVKGYQGDPGGKVLTALEAIARCGTIFAGYTIVIHSAIGTYASSHLADVQKKATEISQRCNLPIEFLPYGPPEKIWELFGQSRLAIAISNADGTPNTMLEAMIMGAYPIQSDTGGLDQWIEHGFNGALVPFDDPVAIARAIETSLKDDRLVDQAAQTNMLKTAERIDRSVIQARVIAMYQQICKSNP